MTGELFQTIDRRVEGVRPRSVVSLHVLLR